MRSSPIKIRARVIRGAGRGRRLGIPTINLDPSAMQRISPSALHLIEGIWACRALLPKAYWGVLHFGPRPVFDEEEKSLEVYLFDFEPKTKIPEELDIEIYGYIREIMNFKSPKELVERIGEDIRIVKKKIRQYEKKQFST